VNRIIRRGPTTVRSLSLSLSRFLSGVASYALPRATTYDDRIATRAAHIAAGHKGGETGKDEPAPLYGKRTRSHPIPAHFAVFSLLETHPPRGKKDKTAPLKCA
jgi:hypothetical protein